MEWLKHLVDKAGSHLEKEQNRYRIYFDTKIRPTKHIFDTGNFFCAKRILLRKGSKAEHFINTSIKYTSLIDDDIPLLLIGIEIVPHATNCYQCDVRTPELSIPEVLFINITDPSPTLI